MARFALNRAGVERGGWSGKELGCGNPRSYDLEVLTTRGRKPVPISQSREWGRLEICQVCKNQLACLDGQLPPLVVTSDFFPTKVAEGYDYLHTIDLGAPL